MLAGTLDDFTLTDVLRLIGGARRTGGLEVTRHGGTGSLYFRDGAVSGARAGYERRTGAPSIEDLAFDLLRWEGGEFTWTPGAAHGEATVAVDDLLASVTARLEELARIHTLVPSEDAVLAMAPQLPQGAVQINITPAEWRVLVLVDGRRTVADVAEAAQLDDLEAMRLLYGLAAAGLVGADGTAPSQEAPDAPDVPDAAPEAPPAPTVVEAEAPPTPEPPAPEPEPATAEPPAPEPDPAALVDEPDPFLADLVEATSSPFDGLDAMPDLQEPPAVDRSTAARELAGLFDAIEPVPSRHPVPRRVEDDDQVTRGLISRLIDGVKGL